MTPTPSTSLPTPLSAPRLLAAVLLTSLLLGLTACGAPDEAPPPSLTPAVDIPHPDLDQVPEGVRASLQQQRQDLEALLKTSSTPPQVAAAYGRLGNFYHAYQLHSAALACYQNALELQPRDFHLHYYTGLLHRDAANLSAAADAFEQAHKVRPDDPLTHLRLAQVQVELGRLDEAAEHLEIAANTPALAAAVALSLGEIAAARGNDTGAVEHFQAVLAAQPDAADARYALAQALRRLDRRGEAEALLAAAPVPASGAVRVPDPLVTSLADLATSAAAFMKRAGEAMLGGRLDEAEALYRKAVAAEPNNAEARRNLALALTQRGNHDGALAELRRAVPLAPQDPWVHFDLGNALLATEHPNQAEDAFRKAVDVAPDFNDGHFNLANLLLGQERFAEARGHLDQVLQLDPSNSRARYLQAVADLQEGRSASAVDRLRQLLRDEPDHIPARKTLASLLLQRQDPSGAQREYEALLRRAEEPRDRAEAHVQLATLVAVRNDVDGAMNHLRQAIETDPTVKEAPLNLANLLVQLKRTEEAVSYYRQAVELDPENGDLRDREATALILLGRYADARDRLEAGVQTVPDDPKVNHTLARLLATAPDESVRDGQRALLLAQRAFAKESSIPHAETIAMAYAELGNYQQAAQWQQGLVNQMRLQRQEQMANHLEQNLQKYLRQEAVRIE